MKLTGEKVLRPLFNYVVVRPININPYIIRKTESGILLSSGAPIEFSQESGQYEKLEQRIVFGVVIDAGDGCKEAQIGDEVYFDRMSTRALPVLDLGYLHMSEQNLLAIVRGDGDAIAEALEFEITLRDELTASNAQKLEDWKQEQRKKSLADSGIIL